MYLRSGLEVDFAKSERRGLRGPAGIQQGIRFWSVGPLRTKQCRSHPQQSYQVWSRRRVGVCVRAWVLQHFSFRRQTVLVWYRGSEGIRGVSDLQALKKKWKIAFLWLSIRTHLTVHVWTHAALLPDKNVNTGCFSVHANSSMVKGEVKCVSCSVSYGYINVIKIFGLLHESWTNHTPIQHMTPHLTAHRAQPHWHSTLMELWTEFPE